MKKSSIQKSSIKKFIITDPSLILDSSNKSFKKYEAKARKNCGEINSGCLINRKDGGRAKIHKLSIMEGYDKGGCVEIGDREIVTESGMLCIASSMDGWDNEEYGIVLESLEKAIEFFMVIKAVFIGFDSKEEAEKVANDLHKLIGGDIHVEERVTTVEVPREELEVPCNNLECPYSNIVNGICTIDVKITDLGGEISITVKCEDETEHNQKMDCVMNYMYEETGIAGKFERGG